ncbi:GNAT family N-acetyltransferase [Nocardia takedensis]|uniref:GNAT family N-acetyltransferase n=1 Tax=Nocardia takedensis TaxID=259390 RepID=UPI0002DD9574|nr:GNAT family N-acetyltransferase [Nocardia takedensis]
MSVEPNLFAGVELVARIEAAERSLIEQGARAAAVRDPAQPVVTLPIGGGSAVWAAPGSPLDKVVGAGLDGDLVEADLIAVEKAFADRGTPVQFEVSTAADPAVVSSLTARGYLLTGFENVSGLRLTPGRTARPAPEVRVRAIEPDEIDLWTRVVVDGFATPDTQGVASHEEFPREVIELAERDMAATDGFRAYLAWIDGVPAGGAGLRVGDGIAQLCGAATLPAFRRRGVQGSLLSVRLADAAAAGCDLAVVTTLPASTSQQNVHKAGFQLLYARAVLVNSRD